MCVGLPAKVMTMKDGMAVVDASGAKREVSAELIENLEPGDYVMVTCRYCDCKDYRRR